MNIIGIGIDLLYVPRIKRLYECYKERFLNKVFAKEEIKYALKRKNFILHLASSFSVKEAFFKATGGYSPFSFKEVILKREDNGKPYLELKGKAFEIFKKLNGNKILVSISHERDYAISIVFITGKSYESCNRF
ncbi:MAG TPA: holo-[acyl-carrier-protein] synthase [Candidatus Desulfofervidus auxilii]|uniref:Holo-[acyl-carrier-protein] synthase n=1 Tax=Desulfofervidus auxilii TaxID=1621989 RepID=A0A7V0NF20_DESA2|nr:holo-[acyl-carrier-protein] synthase [Candidatus Desulfofervidus auxilii]